MTMAGKIVNQEAFLQQVAKKLGRDKPEIHVEKPEWTNSPQDKVFQGFSQDELVEALKNQCTLIHTDVMETTKAMLPEVLFEMMKQYGLGSVVRWDDPRFEMFGLEELFHKQLPEHHTVVHTWDPDQGETNKDIAAAANIGVTFSDLTLAESGTVVLFSSAEKGRSVSLLPATYIAIVPKSTIVARMTQAARKIEQRVRNGEEVASCVNFISGPSNSADIEMNLIVGVHGPIKTGYIIVEDM